MIRICLLLLMLTDMVTAIAWASRETDAAIVEPETENLLKARFQRAGVHYPPERIQLIALKETKRLELWVWAHRKWWHIHDYPVFAASGHAGPKLKEGDKQVPEGFYRIDSLNPNSNFHLSLKLDFPNPFDWKNAAEEGRKTPGSNIFIHGSAWSKGCLAVGNRNVEELYTLVSSVGTERVQVLIAPYDFRERGFSTPAKKASWVEQLYGYLNARMRQFPLTAKLDGCSTDCLVHQGWHTATP